MISSSQIKCLVFIFSVILLTDRVLSIDLTYTEILAVNDDTRFRTLNPDTPLLPFNKVRHVKGNFIFTAGERVSGDRLLVTFLDETQFTKSGDVEVQLKYPGRGAGSTISLVEIFVDMSSNDANAYFFDGGVNTKFANMLLECNQTRHFSYEIFMYGY